jgi:transposase-like protein
MSQALEITEASLSSNPRPAAYKDYSPEFKAQTLVLLETNAGNVSKTAKENGINESTLRYWIEEQNKLSREIREGAKGDIADAFERVSRLYLDRAAEPGAIEKTSGYYAVIAASDAIKSAQLLRGQPTSISGSVMSEDERRLRVAELLAGIQARAQTSKSDPDPLP